jgi:RNA polymerase sigma-70 factor (ECF subfamily)
MNAINTAHMFDLLVAPVLASEPFADLCRSLTKDPDIVAAVTVRALELRDAWDSSVSPTAWCHAIARDVVINRRKARREYERQVVPLRSNLYGAAMKLTRDPDAADDLVQDTMLRAWRFWGTYEQGTNVKAWLFVVLRNTFINGYHKAGRATDFANAVSSDMRSLGDHAAIAHSHSSPPGPEERVSAEMQRVLLHAALNSLPADYRTAVAYADLDGLSYKEIAAAMDCPIGTVMSRIYRGRRMLQAILERRENPRTITVTRPHRMRVAAKGWTRAHADTAGSLTITIDVVTRLAFRERPAHVRPPVASAQCELFAAGWE